MLAPVDAAVLPYSEPDTNYIPLPADHCSASMQELIRALTAPFAQRMRISRMPEWDPVAQRLQYDV
jgi:hypothetical protein